MDQEITRLNNYVAAVLSGELPSCRYIVKAVERYQADLKRSDLYLDEAEFKRFIAFASEFKHYKGEMAGQLFRCEDWQLFIVANVLCLKWSATGRRKYRLADIYVPRKNGKTMFASILSLFLFLMDGEAGPEVYTAALDQEQARLCYDAAIVLLQNSIFTSLAKIQPSRVKAEGTANHGVFKPLSRDTKNKDGLNIHAAVCDERHAWPNTEMIDVIKTGMGARSQPLVISISTAGIDVSYPYFADIEAYKGQLDGTMPLEETHFYMLYTPDENDQWDSEQTWKKVNPNLGVSLSWDYMRAVCEEAKARGGSYEVAFKTKNLNMWVDAPEVWLADDAVAACNESIDESQLIGKKCYVGIDLASKKDITAVCYLFPDMTPMVAKFSFIVPEQKIIDKEDRVDYRLWQSQGWLVSAPGTVLDEDWFIDYLMKELNKYNIQSIAYDPWGMWNILPKFGVYKNRLDEFKQNIGNMSVPTKELETYILSGKINLMFNPIIRWMFKNVVVYIDPNANIKLDKARSRDKIDGVVALVDAIGGWLTKTKGQVTAVPYATHTLRTLHF